MRSLSLYFIRCQQYILIALGLRKTTEKDEQDYIKVNNYSMSKGVSKLSKSKSHAGRRLFLIYITEKGTVFKGIYKRGQEKKNIQNKRTSNPEDTKIGNKIDY